MKIPLPKFLRRRAKQHAEPKVPFFERKPPSLKFQFRIILYAGGFVLLYIATTVIQLIIGTSIGLEIAQFVFAAATWSGIVTSMVWSMRNIVEAARQATEASMAVARVASSAADRAIDAADRANRAAARVDDEVFGESP